MYDDPSDWEIKHEVRYLFDIDRKGSMMLSFLVLRTLYEATENNVVTAALDEDAQKSYFFFATLQ